MPIKLHIHKDHGHPWDASRKGFDVMELSAENDEEMDRAVTAATKKFWQPWLIGTNERTGKPGGVMFKPCGIKQEWHDSPDNPHPGISPSEETMERPRG